MTYDDFGEIKIWAIRTLVTKFFLAVVFYIFYFGAAPHLLLKRKWLLFFVVFIVFDLVYTYGISWLIPAIYKVILPPDTETSPFNIFFFTSLWYHFIYGVYGTLFCFTIDWFNSKQKQKELEKQSISGELALLRSQVNPHFLFNTLNNINSFVYRDPDKTSFGIIKLAEIMRYMLYEANAEKVQLEKEIDYINSFIALQAFRVNDPDFVKFNISGATNTVMLPPMLLTPFVENAFKHGRKRDVSPGIVINLEVIEGWLSFHVMNFMAPQNSGIEQKGGFGLKSIRRRLDLIYNKNYTLNVNQTEKDYIIDLKIKLS